MKVEINKKSQQFVLSKWLLLVACFVLIMQGTLAQTFDSYQMDLIRERAKEKIQNYENYLNLIGDINEPHEIRIQNYKREFLKLFDSQNTYVVNDLDPEEATSKEFTADKYADNVILWYNQVGISFEINLDDLQFGRPRQHRKNIWYVDVHAGKKLDGLYMGRKLNRRMLRQIFRIAFEFQAGVLNEFRIAGITTSSGNEMVTDNTPENTPKPAPETEPSTTRYSWEPEMVFVKGGTFTMGCTSEQSDCDDDEKPVHEVTVDDFYMGKYEITQKQWREVMGSDPVELNFKGCDDCPVERVSWNDIQEFIKKLNQKTGKKYRLPTEAEWEYAARGGVNGSNTKYAGSNNINEVAWCNGNSNDNTHPVGQKQRNELGIYDMSGNVWEWCADWYDSNYYSNSPRNNPQGPSSGSHRVLRGGSWYFSAHYCRVANRFNYTPDNRFFSYGFRLAVSP